MTSTVDAQADARQLNWLLANFAKNTDGVREAVAVSSDGLLIATSDGLERTQADRLAAIVSSMSNLGQTTSKHYDMDGMKLIMVEMRRGFLLVSAIKNGSCLGVLADSQSDVGLIGYEISVLAARFGDVLTPALITESRRYLPR